MQAHRDTQGKCYMMDKVEIGGVITPQVKEHQGFLAVKWKKSKKDSSLEVCSRQLDFERSASKTVTG